MIARLIGEMVQQGAVPSMSLAGIGPAIEPCCYEVGPEFQVWFPRSVKIQKGSHRMDLKAEALAQMNEAGIPIEKIVMAPWCASCAEVDCLSYRREGRSVGRMLTGVMIS